MMNIDLKNPVNVTVITFLIMFLMIGTFLYLVKPKMVLVRDNTGKNVTRWSVLLAVSVSMASAISVAVLFFLTNRRSVSGNTFVDSKIRFVPNE